MDEGRTLRIADPEPAAADEPRRPGVPFPPVVMSMDVGPPAYVYGEDMAQVPGNESAPWAVMGGNRKGERVG